MKTETHPTAVFAVQRLQDLERNNLMDKIAEAIAMYEAERAKATSREELDVYDARIAYMKQRPTWDLPEIEDFV